MAVSVTDPFANERCDDHLEALPCGGALGAPHQLVDDQPDEQQTGDQIGHSGIFHRHRPRREVGPSAGLNRAAG